MARRVRRALESPFVARDLPGREAVARFEVTRQMALVAKPATRRDLRGDVAALQQRRRAFETRICDVAVRRQAGFGFEEAREMKRAQTGDLGEFFERQIGVEMRLNKIANAGESAGAQRLMRVQNRSFGVGESRQNARG